MTGEKQIQLPSWDLSDLYDSIDSVKFVDDLVRAQDLCKNFAKDYQGKITRLLAPDLANSIKRYEQISDLLEKIGSYAFLVFATDQLDEKRSTFYQDTTEKINHISRYLIFYSLELNKINEIDLAAKLKDKNLAYYQPWLRDLRVFKPYQLAENQEQILHQKQITSNQAWVKLFDETQAQMRFDYDAKSLSNQEIFKLLTAVERTTREKAAKAIEQQFVQHAKIFASITNVVAKDKQINDDLRGFALPISARNIANLIEDEVVNKLIVTVKANYQHLSHDFYQLKAKILGLNKLEYWDRLAPIQQVAEIYIPWPEAVQIVLEAYHTFSPLMAKIAQEFIDNGWVDAILRPGKYSGAFACAVAPSVHPYVLVNYQGKARDVMTLAHELGHAVHMQLAKTQGALMCTVPLILAETASIFAEQLTFELLLKREQNPEVKKSILANKIDDLLSTVVRQIAFTEYELGVHNSRAKGELTIDQLNKIWLKTQQESLGPIFHFSEKYKYFWQYVPHFIHSPFYVYAYAFANCLVNSLYAQYKTDSTSFVNKYIEMLAAGGSKRYNQLLARFDLDANEEHFWQSGLDVIANYINQLKILVA